MSIISTTSTTVTTAAAGVTSDVPAFYETAMVPEIATTWHRLFRPLESALGAVSCLDACPDNPLGEFDARTVDPCYSSYMSNWAGMMSSIVTMTEGQEAAFQSQVSLENENQFGYLSCICNKEANKPWSTAATGVCDSGTYTECKDPSPTDALLLNLVHEEYSSLCNVIDLRVAGQTTADTTDSTGGSSQPIETGGADGESSVGKTGVSLSAALLVGFMGACMML